MLKEAIGYSAAISIGDLLLFTQAKPFYQRPVALHTVLLQIIEQLAPTAYHPQQTAAGVMILDMRFEMIGQIIDTSGQ